MRASGIGRPLAVALLATFICMQGWAQTPRTPEVLVTATRFQDRVERMAINASVITSEEITRSTARTLPDLLGSRAGVMARDLFGNDATSSTVDMRGFGATAAQNTLILVDGRRINDIDQSGVQWASIPLESIERIEILRGSGSVQYGDGATGGVINIITRHPVRDGSRVAGSARLGGYDTREVNASANASGEAVGLSAFARNYESSGYRDNNHNRASNFVLSGTWSGSAADATLRVAGDRQGVRLPGARLVQPSAGIDQLSTDRRGTSTPLDYAQRDGNQATLDVRSQLAGGELALGLGYRNKAQRSYFDFSGFPDYRDIDLDVFTLQPRYRWRTSAWGGEHTFVVGADIARWDYSLLRSTSASNVWQPFNRVGATQHNAGIYLLDTVQLGERMVINVGARRERQRIDASDVLDTTAPGGAFGSAAPDGSQDNWANAYELGLRYRLAPQTTAIARTARSFRFANIDEIYETSPFFTQQFQFLQPQNATTYEAGLALGDTVPWLQASLFHMNVKNEIHLDPYSTGVGNRNMPPIERNGFELELRHTLVPTMVVSGAYTYTRARFEQGQLPGSAFTQSNVDIAGRTVPLVPKHKVDLAADWMVSANTRVRADARYVSEQYMENDESNAFDRRIPSHMVWDVKLEHRQGAFTASAGIGNVFDRKYYTYAVRSQFVADRFNAYPLPERTFWLGLAYNGF